VRKFGVIVMIKYSHHHVPILLHSLCLEVVGVGELEAHTNSSLPYTPSPHDYQGLLHDHVEISQLLNSEMVRKQLLCEVMKR
jgi:hypothetical protein